MGDSNDKGLNLDTHTHQGPPPAIGTTPGMECGLFMCLLGTHRFRFLHLLRLLVLLTPCAGSAIALQNPPALKRDPEVVFSP